MRCHGLGGNQAWTWGDGGSIRHRCCLNIKQNMLFLIKSCRAPLISRYIRHISDNADIRIDAHRQIYPHGQVMLLFLFSVSGKCLASNPGEDSPFLVTCSGELNQKWQLGGSIAWKSEDQ